MMSFSRGAVAAMLILDSCSTPSAFMASSSALPFSLTSSAAPCLRRINKTIMSSHATHSTTLPPTLEAPGKCESLRLHTAGAIHLIMGPMFAGKTTTLLQRVRLEAGAGRRVSLVKSDKDTRYGVGAVVSHDGVQMPCVAVPSLAMFREHVGEEEYRQMEVIGIDEAQFFDDLFDFCQSAADFDRKTVIVAGLDGDFLRRRFGSAMDLIPLADSVTKLCARCEICGQPAPFTIRKTGNTQTVVIGGADVYMPVCRHHFVSG